MKFTALAVLICGIAWGQSTGIPALPMSVQVISVPGSTAATYLNIPVDASPTGETSLMFLLRILK